jgi:large repetitive protein
MKIKNHLLYGLGLSVWGAGAAFAQPSITDFYPTVGSPGDQVYLFGTGFTTSGNFDVYFWNGQPVTAGFVNSDQQITVIVPDGISTGPIGIQPLGGLISYTAGDFTAIGPGPYISDVVPAYGAVNDLITITGAHLTNAPGFLPVVKFNGVASASVSVNAAGAQLTARVPPGATNGLISVTTAQGTGNSPAPFVVIGPGPYIVGFLPIKGGVGQMVTITGVHFLNATNATFNGQPGFNFFVQSDSQIQVAAPPGVTTGPIAVNAPLGSSVSASNFFVQPAITNVAPVLGRAGTNVTLLGANLLGATAVTFNGTAATYTVVNNTNIQVTVPVGATTGLIRVTTPAFSGFSPSNFVVLPTLSGFSPNIGIVGSSVTLTGANLNVGTPVVRFNGVAAAAPTGVSFSQLTAVVPAGATTGPLSVTTTDGSDTNANIFYLPPAISGFSPTNTAPGTRITLTGANFLGATAVSFNGAPAASFTVSNNTTLGAVVPAGVTTGPLRVTAPAGIATSADLFYGAPVIADFAPKHGLPGTTVTLVGTNFLGTTAVRFNGLAGNISLVSNGQIQAVVPSGAQTGPISVVAPGGTNTTAANFVLDYASDLQVQGTDSPNPVSVGSNLIYSLTIHNAGPSAAPNARLTNTLPPSVRLLAASITAPWTLNTNGNPITGIATNFISAGTATLLLTVAPEIQGTIYNTITVTSDNSDPAPSNNTSTIGTAVEPLALLSVRLLTNQVRISWPAALTNYVLESKNSLQPTTFFSNVTTVPVILGLEKLVTETNSDPMRVYRLKK